MGLQFERDDTKARTILTKHRVSFEEASTVFGDELSLTIHDREHSTEEDRFVTMGMSAFGKLLVVIHTDRKGGIRIISARPASRHERTTYEESQA